MADGMLQIEISARRDVHSIKDQSARRKVDFLFRGKTQLSHQTQRNTRQLVLMSENVTEFITLARWHRMHNESQFPLRSLLSAWTKFNEHDSLKLLYAGRNSK